MSRATLFVLATLFSLNAVSRELTVVIQTDEVFSSEARHSMEAEASRIVRQAGIEVRFVDWTRAVGMEFADLVVFRMSGRCTMDGPLVLPEERGPYASASVAAGVVLPFGEVRCNRVRESLRRAMTLRDQSHGDALFGRALGRVLAHEVYHMAGNTLRHGKDGIAVDELSARQLIANELNLANRDCVIMGSRRDFRGGD